MRRFAYSTNAYTNFPLTEALTDIARRGFDGVEILADSPHLPPPPSGGEDLSQLKTVLEKTGLQISNLNGNTSHVLDSEARDPHGFWPSLIEPDRDARARRVDYVRGVIDLARRLGANTVCTASGRLPGGMSRKEAGGLVRESLERIVDHAAGDPPVRLGIEYEPGFHLGDMRSVLQVLRDVDHPLLGVNLDVGHAVCAGDDIAEAVDRFRGRIWNLHVEDIRGREHRHLIPGEGDLPFGQLRDALDRAGYDGFLTLELYPYKDDPGAAGTAGLEFLKRLFG